MYQEFFFRKFTNKINFMYTVPPVTKYIYMKKEDTTNGFTKTR